MRASGGGGCSLTLISKSVTYKGYKFLLAKVDILKVDNTQKRLVEGDWGGGHTPRKWEGKGKRRCIGHWEGSQAGLQWTRKLSGHPLG